MNGRCKDPHFAFGKLAFESEKRFEKKGKKEGKKTGLKLTRQNQTKQINNKCPKKNKPHLTSKRLNHDDRDDAVSKVGH